MTVWVVVVETDSDDTGYLKSIVGIYSTQERAEAVAAEQMGIVEAFEIDADQRLPLTPEQHARIEAARSETWWRSLGASADMAAALSVPVPRVPMPLPDPPGSD